MINFICFAIAFFFVGMQLQLSELALLSRHYNYKLKTAQMVTYVAALVSLGVLIYDIFAKHQVFYCCLSLCYVFSCGLLSSGYWRGCRHQDWLYPAFSD